MRKQEIIKKIVENDDFKDKYWSDFHIDEKIADYSVPIIKSGNKFLLALLEIVNQEKTTSKLLFKKIFNLFDL